MLIRHGFPYKFCLISCGLRHSITRIGKHLFPDSLGAFVRQVKSVLDGQTIP